jgi:hypothetical protein
MHQSKEIFRTARSPIKEHGEAAVHQAAVVISDRQCSGDADGAELWCNIQAAISILSERTMGTWRSEKCRSQTQAAER